MVRWLTLGLALLTACGTDRPPVASPAPSTSAPTVSATPTPTPTPSATSVDGVTMTVETRTAGTAENSWTIEVPTLHGLPQPVLDRMNPVLASVAILPREEDETGPTTAERLSTLSAVDGRNVTVEVLTSVFPEGAAHSFQTLETYVFDRGTGDRITLPDWFVPEERPAAYAAMAEHLRKRVRSVLGDEGVLEPLSVPPRAPILEDVTPLPEGLEVAFGSYQVAPYAAGLPRVTVPWNVLEPYLAGKPRSTVAGLGYRDGRRLHGADADAVRAVVEAEPRAGLAPGTFEVARIQRAQYFADDGWAFATVVVPEGDAVSLRAVVVLREEQGTWSVVATGRAGALDCAKVPAPVRASVALECG